jgi:hypothetical protein
MTDPLRRDAAALDEAMRTARERIAAGGTQATAAARDELTRLEKRYAVVRQQLHDLETRVDERAATIRNEAKTAVKDLKQDLDRFADGIRK